MNSREKKEWIIRYTKKHGIDDILSNKYSSKRESVLKRYSSEIQVICSLVSVLLIGFVSLIVSFMSNEISEKQLEISKYESRPILSISLERNTESGLDSLSIINTGKAPLSFSIDVISYFDCLANENHFGSIPIRVYTFRALESMNYNSANSKELAELVIYNDSSSTLRNIAMEINGIVRSYTNYAWLIRHTYLIRISYVDILNENNTQYFICNNLGAQCITNELAQQIQDECYATTTDNNGSQSSIETFYLFKEISAKQLFSVALEKMRTKKLYIEDNGVPVLYGEYEPQTKKTDSLTTPTSD